MENSQYDLGKNDFSSDQENTKEYQPAQNENKKKPKLALILIIFAIILLSTGGTFAYFKYV